MLEIHTVNTAKIQNELGKTVKTSQRRCLIRNRLSHLGMRMFLLLLGSSTVCAERGGQETGDRVKVLLQHGRRPRPGTTHGALRTVGSPWKQLL